ncbi:MAG: hypothetical protein ACI977_000175 [Candidatus Nanohaloarchaea archaeon]|jgi:hypothetical protein
MSKEKDIVVSGIMFLVGIESYKTLFTILSYNLCGCDTLTRFAAYLIMGTLVAASAISLTVSFGYFKRFSHKVCDLYLEESKEE